MDETKRQSLRLLGCVALVLTLLMLTACSVGNDSASGSEISAGTSVTASTPDRKPSGDSLELTTTQLQALQALISQPSTSPEMARQAQMILAVAGGMDNADLVKKFGKDADQVDLKELLKELQQ